MSEKLHSVKCDVAGATSLDVDALTEKVLTSLSKKWRDRISGQSIRKVVAGLDLADRRSPNATPRLLIRRLRFIGLKHLHGDPQPVEIDYDQSFMSGVNVVLIPDNLVGKSSIMKIIEFALTGDNDIDKDVGAWISDIWLHFSLDERRHTVLLSTRQNALRGALVSGDTYIPIEEVVERSSYLFNASGVEQLQSELQHFFFTNLGLTELSWMQNDPSSPSGSARRSTSWRTYYQALAIEDLGDKYLICDQEHNIGQQEIKILSTFLGLSLASPLNELGVEKSRVEKELKAERQQLKEETLKVEEEKAHLEAEREDVISRLADLERRQRERRRLFYECEPTLEIRRLQDEVVQKTTEKSALELDREEYNLLIQQQRTQARITREAIRLRLHFTGLDVTLCPNCDATVDEEAITKEAEKHHCRLCSKPARGATPEQIEAEEALAENLEAQVERLEAERTATTARISRLQAEIEAASEMIDSLKTEIDAGMVQAWPTPEEEAERESLNRQIGGLDALIQSMSSRTEAKTTREDQFETQYKIVEGVRNALEKEAESRNKELKRRLADLTQELVELTGADSISDIEITPMGTLKLKKNDTPVSFTQIMNQGERLRLKLALFLAMLQLGREPGLGRHPGLLLIDQPGSAEMVPEDIQNLASIFWNLDERFGDRLQILCFTAEEEFRHATNPDKVHGPKAGKYAF